MFTPGLTCAPALTSVLLMPTLASTPTFGLTVVPVLVEGLGWLDWVLDCANALPYATPSAAATAAARYLQFMQISFQKAAASIAAGSIPALRWWECRSRGRLAFPKNFLQGPSMIDLYAAGSSNGMRARIGLEECGLAYNLHPIDLTKGEQKSPSFLAMNPNGQIPVIVDSDGPGGKPVTLSQSVAVLMYCAAKSGKFLPKDPAARPAFWQALASAASHMSGMITAIFTLSRAKDQHGPAIDTFKSMWKSYMKVWDEKLRKQRYAAGSEGTIADFAPYGRVARLKAPQPAPLQGFANVARWADGMSARPLVQRAMKF